MDVARQDLASLPSSLLLRYSSEFGADDWTWRGRVRYILEKIVVRGSARAQPFDASRAGTVIPLQSIEGSLARNLSRIVESSIGGAGMITFGWWGPGFDNLLYRNKKTIE